MPRNKAELGVQNDLANRIATVERVQNDMKTYPQKNGNGDNAYAVFTSFALGPVTVAAGGRQTFILTFMDSTQPFFYNGVLAINRLTWNNLFITPYIDTHDTAHTADLGTSLTAGQAKVDVIASRLDYALSGLSETNGQFVWIVKTINNDSSSHNVYLDGTALIPRPAIKPL